jgi:autotransporter-associated beta strand protein
MAMLAHAEVSLIAYLPLDGDTTAGPGTTLDGTAIGTNAASPTYVDGKFGQAAAFANTNANTTTPNDWAVSLGNLDSVYEGDFSISLWVRWTGTPNASVDKAIMGNSNWASGNNTGWLVTSLGANREGKLKTNTGPRRDQGIAWKDGNWNLINLVVDNTSKLGFWYLNGTLLNPAGANFGEGTFGAGLNTLIGGGGSGTYSANFTQIDEVAVFSGQLTPQHIADIWNDGDGETIDTVDFSIVPKAIIWTGALGDEWTTEPLDAPDNWVMESDPLTSAGFLDGDSVLFTPDAQEFAIAVDPEGVSPAAMQFDDDGVSYSLSGGTIGGTGGLEKSGDGTLTLALPGTFSGPTSVQAGTLVVGHAEALSGSVVSGNGGDSQIEFGTGIVEATFGGIAGDGDLSLQNADSDPVALSVGANNIATTYAGSLSGSGSLTKAGAGTLTLAGASTYPGGTTLGGGIVFIEDTNALGGGPVAHDGGQLRFSFGNGSSETFANDVVLRETGHQAFMVRAAGNAAPSVPTTVTLSGKISGGTPGQIYRLLDSGTVQNHFNILELRNPENDFQGTIEMWRGTLGITGDDVLGNPENDIIHYTENLNGKLRFDGPDVTLNPLRQISFPGGSNIRPIDTQTYDARIEGPLTGSAILVKLGSGKLTLAGDTSFTGIARIDQGTLALDDDARLGGVTTIQLAEGTAFDISAVQDEFFLGSSQTIIGNGTVIGHIEVVGTLSPGGPNGIGVINHQGSVLLDQGMISLRFDSRTAECARLFIDGDLAVEDFATLQIIDLATAAGEETQLPNATKLVLVEYTGSFTADFLDLNNDLDVPEGATLTIGMNEFIVSYDDPAVSGNGSKFITLTVPGEPESGYAAWAALHAGGQAPDLDFDGDGVPNGVEYFMGETGQSFTRNPQVVTDGAIRTITWPRDPAAGATFAIETSATLAADEWTTITPPDPAIDLSDPTQVVFTLPADTQRLFIRLAVTIDP